MCYNCGCGLPNDDMGVGHAELDTDGKSITDETFTKLGEKWGMDKKAVQAFVFDMLQGTSHDDEKQSYMEHLFEHAADSQGMSIDESKQEALKLLKKQLGK